MDALTYFLFHSFVYNLLLGLVFFAFGLLAGWWIWARWQRRAEETALRLQFAQTQLTRLKSEIEPLRSAPAAVEAKLTAAETVRTELQARYDALGSRASRLELERQASGRLLDEARETAQEGAKRAAELESQLGQAAKRIADLQAQVDQLHIELEKTPTVALDQPGG